MASVTAMTAYAATVETAAVMLEIVVAVAMAVAVTVVIEAVGVVAVVLVASTSDMRSAAADSKVVPISALAYHGSFAPI